jgi:hypothetical protein
MVGNVALACRLGGRRELTPAQTQNNEYQSLVQPYKALGGGWK